MLLKIFHKIIKWNYKLLFTKLKFMINQSSLRNECLEYYIIITYFIIHFFMRFFLL